MDLCNDLAAVPFFLAESDNLGDCFGSIPMPIVFRGEDITYLC
jgi:hypothetical protein